MSISGNSNTDPFDGPYRKLDRARHHLHEFNEWRNAFYEERFHEAAYQYDHNRGCYRLSSIDDWTIPPDVAPIIGDLIHNLRSCLDHLTWRLARKPDRRNSFPVYDDPVSYAYDVRTKLRGIKPGARAVIERLQPYNGEMEPNWLRLIHQLDNIDKHQILLVAASRAAGGGGTPGVPSGARILFLGYLLERDMPFMEVYWPFDPNMQMNFIPSADIVFRDGPARHMTAWWVLEQMVAHVADDILPLFRPSDFW